MRRALQSLLLAAALALGAVVALDFWDSGPSPAAELLTSVPSLPAEVGAQSGSWRWTQTTGEATRIEVVADRFVRDAEGSGAELQGVELKVLHDDSSTYDRVESAAMRMLAGGRLRSEGETLIAIGMASGGGRPAAARVIASAVAFDPAASSAFTERRVEYSLPGAAGTAEGAAYHAASSVLELLSDVRLDGFGDGTAGTSSTVRAGRLRYSEGDGRIELGRGAALDRQDLHLECASATLKQVAGRLRWLECLEASGWRDGAGARTLFSAPALAAEFGADGALQSLSGRGGARMASAASTDRFEVRSAAMDLRFDRGNGGRISVLRELEATGDAAAESIRADGSLLTISSDGLLIHLAGSSEQLERIETLAPGRLRQASPGPQGASTDLRAGRVRLDYSEGRLHRLRGSSGVQLVQRAAPEQAAGLSTWSDLLAASFADGSESMGELLQSGGFRFEEGSRRGRAAAARFDGEGGRLELSGDASVSGEGAEVSAALIRLERASGLLEASGEVALTLRSREGGAERAPIAFFGAREAVYGTADSLLSDPDRQTIDCRGAARLWQGPTRLDAAEIVVDLAARGVRAAGGVAAFWSAGASGLAGERSVTRSERMTYEEASSSARFVGAVDFRRDGMRVLSDELVTSGARGGGAAPRSAVARGSVRISDGARNSSYRAAAERAEFAFADSTVELRGEPAWLQAADGTRSEGVVLTYSAAGDRLLLAGRGAERAVTYRPAPR